MKQESENALVEQKQMEEVEPMESDKQEDPKGMDKESKGPSAEPDIQAFMYHLMD